MSTYDELFPRVSRARQQGKTILEVLEVLQGEMNLAALGAAISRVYGTLRWGEANYLICQYCENEGPLRWRAVSLSVADRYQRLATERPTETENK